MQGLGLRMSKHGNLRVGQGALHAVCIMPKPVFVLIAFAVCFISAVMRTLSLSVLLRLVKVEKVCSEGNRRSLTKMCAVE